MTVAARIREYIVSAYLSDREDVDLTEATPLLDLNIIDSFAIFDLVNFLTREMGVRIPVDRIHLESFQSIGEIVGLIEDLSENPAPD